MLTDRENTSDQTLSFRCNDTVRSVSVASSEPLLEVGHQHKLKERGRDTSVSAANQCQREENLTHSRNDGLFPSEKKTSQRLEETQGEGKVFSHGGSSVKLEVGKVEGRV